MVNIWLTTIISTITINHLVGGFNHLEKYEFVNGNDYPIYEMENNIHVPNHQPGELILTYFNRVLLLIKLGLLEISPSFSPMMFHSKNLHL